MTLFEKFKGFLDRQQVLADRNSPVDIRARMLEDRYARWQLSYRTDVAANGFGANLRDLFPNYIDADHPLYGRDTRHLVLGAITEEKETSHNGALNAFEHVGEGDEVVFFEQGFLASAHSWAEANAKLNPSFPCLGYVYDDLGYYYMAEFPNRLTRKLNSGDTLTGDEIARARALINRIADRRISKYNSQPIRPVSVNPAYKRRVLVCDQAYRDASTIYGLVNSASFEEMLRVATEENPDAEILVKTHPDTVWASDRRTGYYNRLESEGRVTILKDPINPYCLFDLVDTVYVGTSGMGLEALFAGKKVVCFGAPFFSGWGLTDDRRQIPHRHRTRSLEELFHYFYVWYTIYNVPGTVVPSRIEDALDYIETRRPVRPRVTDRLAGGPPKVSVIVPVYNVENYLEDCMDSILNQSLTDIEVIAVDDCATDSSGAILDRLAAEDARIVPVHLECNVGLGFARNAGLDRATGDYVFFLDSDDLLASNHVVERALDAATSSGADMVRVQKLQFDDGISPALAQPDPRERFFSETAEFHPKEGDLSILRSWHCWLYLYRRDLIDRHSLRFITRKWEERSFVLKALARADKVIALPVPGVLYRQRPASISNSERTDADLAEYLQNVAEATRHVVGTALSTVAAFQFAGTLTDGAWRRQVKEALNDFEARRNLAESFAAFDLTVDGISAVDRDLLPEEVRLRRLHLFLAALGAGRWATAETAFHGLPISQSVLIAELFADPSDSATREFQAALSLYARNENVETTKTRLKAEKPRIVIHIGSSKTGSTFIQHFLERNRPDLLRAGVYYPEVGLFWQPNRPHKQAGHVAFSQACATGDMTLKAHVASAIQLAHDAGQPIHTVILSSEAFFLGRQSIEIARAFSDHPVEMVCYFRRQDRWAMSQYAEFVAGGSMNPVHVPFGTWIDLPQTRQRMDYNGLLGLWASVIGKDAIHARIYDRESFDGGDIVSDFMNALGLDRHLDLPRPVAGLANDFPFNGLHVELIRGYNAAGWPSHAAYLDFIEEATRAVSAFRKDRGLWAERVDVATPDQLAAILEGVADGNARMSELYFSGRDPFPAVDGDTDEPPPTLDPREIGLVSDAFQKNFSQPRPFEEKIVNYGFFGWRRWLLTPFVRMAVAKQGTGEDLDNFDNEPASYMRGLTTPKFRKLARKLYPDGSVLGPGDILGLWVAPVSRLVRKLGGPKEAEVFRRNPVRFLRRQPGLATRIGARLLFPFGELVRVPANRSKGSADPTAAD